MKIEFGKSYRELITGISGIAVGLCTYITGCDKVLIQPKVKDGENTCPDSYWFDVTRVVELLDKKVVIPETDEPPGGDMLPPRI
jgi:hypothetical protein